MGARSRQQRRNLLRMQKDLAAPAPGVLDTVLAGDLLALQEAGKAELARRRADAWTRSPEGTPYGSTEVSYER
jgi:hypothetical protein